MINYQTSDGTFMNIKQSQGEVDIVQRSVRFNVPMFLLAVSFPECWSPHKHVSDHNQSHRGEAHSDDCTEDDIKRMMSVVTDSRQADPEGEDDHAKLEEGTDDLETPDEPSDTSVVDPREVVEPGLEVDD